MSQRSIVHGVLVALAGMSGVAADAVAQGAAAAKSATIERSTTRPAIDGVLAPDEWAGAAVIDDFHQVEPIEYERPSERTVVYIKYDEAALYVGVHSLDAPQDITANILKLGESLAGDDRVKVIIDPFGDGRSGYSFIVNANGVRRQALFENASNENFNWKAIWEARAARTEDGWTAEMEIPFKSLSFDPNRATWGLNIERNIERRSEVVGWSSRNQQIDPSTAGQLTGFAGLDQGIGLDVVPSLSVRRNRDHAADQSDTGVEPSVDVFYKVTPALTASLTFNTDFSATEVDDREVNLSRFGLFFPEKRAFFLQDADIFEFGRFGIGSQISGLQNGRPFFSRRIGLSDDGTPVDLRAGGKLTGRIGRWSVGVLDVQQAAYDSPSGPIDSRNLFVGRASANVLGESNLGFIVTNGDPASNLSNTLVGADFRYLNTRLAGGRVLEGELWYQQTDTEGLSGDDASWGARLRSPNNAGIRGGLGVKEIQQNFNPALGFVNNAGIRDFTGDAGHTWLPLTGAFQSLYSGVEAQHIRLIDGGLQLETLEWRALELETRSGDAFEVSVVRTTEVLQDPFEIFSGVVVPVDRYEFDEFEVEFEASGHRILSGSIAYRQGDFYSGSRRAIEGEVLFRPSPHVALGGAYEFNDVDLPQGDFIARLMRLRVDVVFSPRLSWTNFVQYDNDTEEVGVNSRLQWIPVAGRETYLVFNHELEDQDRDRSFRSATADVVLKAGYTFRF